MPDEKPRAEETGRAEMFGFVSRRKVLKWGLGGLASLAGLASGAGGLLLSLRGCAPDVAGLKALSNHEYRTLSNLAAAIIPRGGAFEVGAADFDMARLFDAFLAGEPRRNVRDLSLALNWLEFGPIVIDHGLTTFSNLSREAQLAHFDSWGTAAELDRRRVSIAFRKFIYLVFYDQEAVWAHIGYGGP